MKAGALAVIIGYLLDTNHVGYYFNKDARVMARLALLPLDSPLRASVISLGEIEAGHKITESTDHHQRDEFDRFVTHTFRRHALPVTPWTRYPYGDLIEGIWRRHPPRTRRIGTEQHLIGLGVDINDVWIAAQAIEYNLVLVTEDAMEPIREAAGKLLDVENWAA